MNEPETRRRQLTIRASLIAEIIFVGIAAAVWAGCHGGAKSPAKAVGADTTAVPAVPVASLTYEQRQGKYLYMKYCTVCHGDHGEGDGFNAYNLDPKPHSLADSAYGASFSDASLARVISVGGRGANKSVLMPAYGHTITPDEIAYLVAYIRSLPQPRNH